MLNLSFGNVYRDYSKLHTTWSSCECAVGLCGLNSAMADSYRELISARQS